MKPQCARCEYEPVCFPALKLWQRYSSISCKQGRQKRTTRAAPVVSDEIVDLDGGL